MNDAQNGIGKSIRSSLMCVVYMETYDNCHNTGIKDGNHSNSLVTL